MNNHLLDNMNYMEWNCFQQVSTENLFGGLCSQQYFSLKKPAVLNRAVPFILCTDLAHGPEPKE